MNKKAQKKESAKPFKLITLDVETRGRYGEIFLIGIYDGERSIRSNNVRFILTHLHSLGQEYDLHVYVHFLDFDLSKMLYHLFETEKIDFNNCIFIRNRVVKFTTENITFHDSYKILPSSLERLCKDFELEDTHAKLNLDDYMKQNGYKDKEDFFKRVPEDDEFLGRYLDNDCISLYHILLETMRLSQIPAQLFVQCPTIATLALRVFQHLFPTDYKKAVSTWYYGSEGEYIEQQVRKGYYGGRTEVFSPIAENAYGYDTNSMYANIMKTMDLPYGTVKKFEKGDEVEPQTVYDIFKKTNGNYGAGFALAKLYVPEHLYIPPLPYKKVSKLLFPTGCLWGVWSFEELKVAEEVGVQIEDVQEVYFWKKKDKLFKGYIEHFEDMKKDSTGAKKAFAKLMQNGLSGKFAMKRDITSYCSTDKKEKLEAEGKPYIELTYNRHKGNEQKYLLYKSRSNAKYIQPHISAYISSYGRIQLFKKLVEQSKKGKIHSCDTDSIVCAEPLNEEDIDSKEYGKWKETMRVSRGLYMHPKLYAEKGFVFDEEKGVYELKEHVKAKGVPRDVIDTLTYSHMEDIYARTISGDYRYKIMQERTTRISVGRALQGNLEVESVMPESKEIHLQTMQKRVVNYIGNDSIPHHFETYESHTPVYWHATDIQKEMSAIYHDVEEA